MMPGMPIKNGGFLGNIDRSRADRRLAREFCRMDAPPLDLVRARTARLLCRCGANDTGATCRNLCCDRRKGLARAVRSAW